MKRGRKPSLLPPAESSLMSLDLPPNFHSGSPTPLYSKDARKIINASLKGLLMGELNATKVGDREEGGVAWKIYPSRSSLVLAISWLPSLESSFFSAEKKKFVLVKRANERGSKKKKISQRRRRKEEIPRGRKRPIRYNRPPFVVESSIIDRAKN